jgi:hypothetical protein
LKYSIALWVVFWHKAVDEPIDLIIYVKLPEVSTLDAALLQKEVDKLSIKVLQRVWWR